MSAPDFSEEVFLAEPDVPLFLLSVPDELLFPLLTEADLVEPPADFVELLTDLVEPPADLVLDGCALPVGAAVGVWVGPAGFAVGVGPVGFAVGAGCAAPVGLAVGSGVTRSTEVPGFPDGFATGVGVAVAVGFLSFCNSFSAF